MVKKYIVKNGNKVTIEINRKPEIENRRSPINQPKGLISSRYEPDYQARRSQPGGINFYDLGNLTAAGSIYRAFFPTITTSAVALAVDVDPIGTIDKNALQAEIESDIFAVPPGDFKTAFKKITKSGDFSKAVLISYETDVGTITETLNESSKFSSNGLRLTQSEAATLQIAGIDILFASGIDCADTSNFKVTSVHDYSAEETEFTPSAKMDIFLMPSVIQTEGSANYNNGLHTFVDGDGVTIFDVVTQLDVLNRFYSTFPRERYADFRAVQAETDGYSRIYRLWQIFKSFPGSRAKRGVYDFIESPPYNYLASWTDTADFPFPAIYTSAGINNSGFVADTAHAAGYSIGYDAENRLMFVIKKNDAWFYFWKI